MRVNVASKNKDITCCFSYRSQLTSDQMTILLYMQQAFWRFVPDLIVQSLTGDLTATERSIKGP